MVSLRESFQKQSVREGGRWHTSHLRETDLRAVGHLHIVVKGSVRARSNSWPEGWGQLLVMRRDCMHETHMNLIGALVRIELEFFIC